MIIAYTTGTYDMFHIGHLNILRNSKQLCDKLVVGVSTDELVLSYKGHLPIIPFNERIEIIKAISYVDLAIPQKNMNKLDACLKLNSKLLIIGDDWYKTNKWNLYEKEMVNFGIKVIYLPYTDGISSTLIKKRIIECQK